MTMQSLIDSRVLSDLSRADVADDRAAELIESEITRIGNDLREWCKTYRATQLDILRHRADVLAEQQANASERAAWIERQEKAGRQRNEELRNAENRNGPRRGSGVNSAW